MVNYEKTDVKAMSGVVHPGHPAVIDTALLADKSAKLKAGTVLKMSASGGTVESAAPADTPAAVLVEDSDGRNAEVPVLWHGIVVRGRLLDSSGAGPAAAGDAMAAKLRAAGIYPIQQWTGSKKG